MALAYEQPTQEQLTKDQERERREEKLVRMLKAEEEDALGYAQTETAEQQMESLRRYFGEKYGDEEDGRSQVVTREVFETIEWTRPDLMRVFDSGGNVVELIEAAPQDSAYAEDVAKYLQWIFWEDNDGFSNLDDFAFDGLLQRRGYLACYWCDKEYRAPQTLSGLNIMQVQQLMADPAVEIVAQDFDQESEAGGISLIVRRTKAPARAVIESIAPEDMRLNGRAVTLDKARYVGRVLRMLRGEIARRWPERADDVREYSGDDSSGIARNAESVRAERFRDDDIDFADTSDDAAEELEVLEEYLRVDLDDDGYPELIRSYRLGDMILEESEVDENPFASWTPTRVPHRFMGLGQHDQTEDLQRQSTVLTRAGLDAVYQSVVNREAFDETKVDPDGPINSTYTGTKIPVKGDPTSAIFPLIGGQHTAPVAWEALEIIKRRIEDRTGATRQTRGLDSDQLSKDHSGAALRQLNVAADARKEMIARNMANGLGDFFSKLYRLVCRNQNQARAAKIAGRWFEFDPRTWNSDLRVKIVCGGVNREHGMVALQLIGQEQAQVIELLGPMNPNVTPANRYAYQKELCRHGNFNVAQFFSEVPPDWQPQQQEDPQMAKAKMDAEVKMVELQKKDEQIRLQAQKDVEVATAQQRDEMARAQMDAEAAALEHQRELLRLQNEAAKVEDDRIKAEREHQIELERLAIEREQMELKRQEIESKERMEQMKAQAAIAQADAQRQQQEQMHKERISAMKAPKTIRKNKDGSKTVE